MSEEIEGILDRYRLSEKALAMADEEVEELRVYSLYRYNLSKDFPAPYKPCMEDAAGTMENLLVYIRALEGRLRDLQKRLRQKDDGGQTNTG